MKIGKTAKDRLMQLLPELTPENEAFWKGGLDDRLMIAACGDCDHRIHPPQFNCPVCWSENVSFIAASGEGIVYSLTTNRQPWSPDVQVPFVLAIVELCDQPGVRLTTRIIGEGAESVSIGDAVKAEFEIRGDIAIPVFKLPGGTVNK